MKLLPRPAALLVVAANLACAEGPEWLVDFEKARKQAVAEDKDLLVDFTGSDWCGFCIQLAGEVFTTEEFLREAPKKFVLVEIDFPEDRSALSKETIAQNDALAKKYRVQTYPTIILMDQAGRPYARTGYRPGGVENYLGHLEALHLVRVERDEHLAAAARLAGIEKARGLAQALAGIPARDLDQFYQDVSQAMVQADPDDQAGVQKARHYREARRELSRKVAGLLGSGDLDAAEMALDAFLAAHNPGGKDRQEVLMDKVAVHMERGNTQAALAQLDAIKTINPGSEIGREVDEFKESIAAYLRQQGSSDEGSSE